MFQFPTFAFHHQVEWHAPRVPGCPIRISADLFVFANPRGLSQLITSFVAFQSPGIPHVPLFTFIPPPGIAPCPCVHVQETAGYDKYTLASLSYGFSLRATGGRLSPECRGGKSMFNELFYFLFFALVFPSSCQRSPFQLFPPCPLAGTRATDSCPVRIRTASSK